MDGSFMATSLFELQRAVSEGGDFNALRARVQNWVQNQKHVSFPCRTEPTAEGINVYYTDRAGKTCRQFVPCSDTLCTQYIKEYTQCGW